MAIARQANPVPQLPGAQEADRATGVDTPQPVPQPEHNPDSRFDDLAAIINAYNQVTQKLQHSHETLKTQVTRLQRELASTNAKLQRSKRLAALGEMAAGIAHEIRNPLAAIQLYAGMLVDDLTNPAVAPQDQQGLAQMAQKIAIAVRGLNSVVCDVLSFARELSPKPSWVPVGPLLDRAVEACRPAINAAGVSVVRLDRQDEATLKPASVYADPTLLYQAMLNLIRNAVEAVAGASQGKGGHTTPPTITLNARQDEAHGVLIVRDNGPGIAEYNIDRIFNPFFTTRNTGTGLGLAIVHRIVDAHSGTISVHNNSGAVFELSLPAAFGKNQSENSADTALPAPPASEYDQQHNADHRSVGWIDRDQLGSVGVSQHELTIPTAPQHKLYRLKFKNDLPGEAKGNNPIHHPRQRS